MRVLIARTDHLGDLVLTTPLIRAMASAGWMVDVLARRANLPVLENSPRVERAVAIDDVAPRFPLDWHQLGKWMRAQRYDALILPHAKPRQLLYAGAAAGIGRKRVAMWSGMLGRLLGYKCLRSGLPRRPRHISDIWLDCARALNVAACGLEPEMHLSEGELEWARQAIYTRFGDSPVVGIHPGSAGNTCNLPPSEYARVCGLLLAETRCGIVVTGAAAERRLVEDWPASTLRSNRLWLSMGDVSLRELAAIISQLEAFVSVGTGPMHMASATGTPTVSPFCPFVGVSPPVWGNLGAPACEIQPSRAVCAKVDGRWQTHCDFKGAITADMIFAGVQRQLAHRPERPAPGA